MTKVQQVVYTHRGLVNVVVTINNNIVVDIKMGLVLGLDSHKKIIANMKHFRCADYIGYPFEFEDIYYIAEQNF